MKKSLLALAVAAALPASVYAQTNVTLFGIADAAVEYVDFDQDGLSSDVRITNGVMSGSRLGVQGTEDLGGGLRGLFYLEHRLNLDNGTQTQTAVTDDAITGQFWQQAYVGLGGGFGEIRLGRDYSIAFRALRPGDINDYNFVNNWSVGLAGTATRLSNAVQYISPSLGGFKIWTMYAAGEQALPYDAKAGDYMGIGITGNVFGFGGGLFYTQREGGTPPAAGISRARISEMGGTLSAKFGPFGLGVSYAEVDPDNGAPKTKGLYGGASLALGAGTVSVIYKKEDDLDQDDRGLVDRQTLGINYAYALSKRTFPYISLTQNDFDFASGVAGEKPISVALGLRHLF